MAKNSARRGISRTTDLNNAEHSQKMYDSVRGGARRHDGDGIDISDPNDVTGVIDGPVAARGGGGNKGGGNGGRGTTPTDITLSGNSVDENSAGGTVIGTLGAVDADRKERFSFSLIDDAGGLFAINGNNRLVVADGANLDFEANPTLDIVVQVTDKQGHTYQETMTISINDLTEIVNAAPTDITLSSTSIDENSAENAVIGTLGNNDPDAGDSWSYQITSDPDQKFAISGNQLVLRGGATLDFETAQSHSVTVLVTDSAGASHFETFVIDVNDLTEIVNTAPTDITLSNTSIDEYSAENAVIGTLGNNDPDADDSWTYQIAGDPGQKFAISGNQLVLRNGATLDYETAQSHSVTVLVTDSADASHFETFVIDVNDVVEPENNGPTDMQLSGGAVLEGVDNGTFVGAVTASDPDAGETFRYTLLDSADGRFALVGDQLEVANISLFDYESQPSHDVTIRVTDSTGNFYDETFTIQVQNVAGALAEQPNYIQALLPNVGGELYFDWQDSNSSTAPTTITFAILTDFPSYYDPANMIYTDYTSGSVSFNQLTTAQRTVIQQLLGEIEDIANVEFVEVGSASQANITFGMYLQDVGIGAYAYYPSASGSTGSKPGDIWLNSRYDTNPTTDDTIGVDWARSTISHELGHALGLKHPGDYNAGGGGTDGPYLDPAVDNSQYTVMSYTGFPNSNLNPVDYMLYDVASLQFIYGANTNYATGDDVYQFSTSAKLIDTVWDAGGFDTFSAAGASSGATIDLNQGGFSSIGLTNNIGIAYGADIEAAIGGAGADRLIGNHLDNEFTGGGGADRFVFVDDWGSDIILDFQNGLDLLDLSDSGFLFADLMISSGGSGAEIAAGTSTLLLAGIDASLVDETDFVFV